MLPPLLLLALLAAQAGLAQALRPVEPPRGDLAPPPDPRAMAALSLGDPQFAFRAASLRLQHAGSLDGRTVAWSALDHRLMAEWFRALDRLDPRPDIVPAMAALLYAPAADRTGAAAIVDYLEDHALRDPAGKWRWLAQAVHVARYRMEDPRRALDLARTLRGLPVADLPYWARQLEVFVLADLGDRAAARALLLALLESDPDLPDHERRWIRWYIARNLDGGGPGGAASDADPAPGRGPEPAAP
ncbi:MAG: hypothetical protein RID91_09500 [Azospirillaceae bacterium]